jgi:hypothetical protein
MLFITVYCPLLNRITERKSVPFDKLRINLHHKPHSTSGDFLKTKLQHLSIAKIPASHRDFQFSSLSLVATFASRFRQ